METDVLVIREEPLPRLASFCGALAEALRQTGLGRDRIFVVFRESLVAECPQCGTRVTGEELFVLAQPEEGTDLNPGLQRLRLGDCARPGCDAYPYRVSFKTHPEVNWTTCLAHIEKALSKQRPASGGSRIWQAVLLRRLGMLAAIVVLLLILRQLYLGGRIPLIREPEKFRVDPAPEGSEFHN